MSGLLQTNAMLTASSVESRPDLGDTRTLLVSLSLYLSLLYFSSILSHPLSDYLTDCSRSPKMWFAPVGLLKGEL